MTERTEAEKMAQRILLAIDGEGDQADILWGLAFNMALMSAANMSSKEVLDHTCKLTKDILEKNWDDLKECIGEEGEEPGHAN